MTSRCENLYDHTSMKATDEILCCSATTLANGGEYFLIDAINPDGTLNDSVYNRLSCVNQQLKPFVKTMKRLKPELVADVGLYFSLTQILITSSAVLIFANC